jgi:Holliday junction resolvase RusA-like endonuclease
VSAVLVAEFMIDGIPVAQGSKNAWVNPKTNKAVMFDSGAAKLKPWRGQIAQAAREAYTGAERIEGAVLLVVEFRFVRPKSVKRERPTVKPDVDKTLRALMDGISDSGIWRDDAQVVTVHMSKVYAERPGVLVQLGEFK